MGRRKDIMAVSVIDIPIFFWKSEKNGYKADIAVKQVL